MKIKPSLIFLLLFIFTLSISPVNLSAEGLENLAVRSSQAILDFFKDKYDVRTAIVKFENFSGLPDITAQKYYQLIAAKLETSKKESFNFFDLMINFSKNRGVFNLNRTGKLNYLIYVKLIKNREKLGAGTVIFSKSLDKIVFLKYYEEFLPAGEKDIINTVNYGFKTGGFTKITGIEAEKNLLDFKSIKALNGEVRYYFYYPGKIEIYNTAGSNFKKSFSFKLNWGRPYYPAKEAEGKLAYFYRDSTLYLTVGNNFSPKSKVFTFRDNRWREEGSLNFVPFQFIKINMSYYLAGAAYHPGKNFFKDKILLAPFRGGKIRKEELYEKNMPHFREKNKTQAFYDAAFAVNGDNLESLHVIDKKYNCRYFAADLVEWPIDDDRRGGAICALDGKWLAISAYSTKNDKLCLYKIQGGSREFVYEKKIKGEIIFISAGAWKSRRGFWVYVRIKDSRQLRDSEYRLQFWSKNDD
ncbi:MAG: hypothetical protein KAW12_02870 [Candidatus Aminicenantes bacterium]|nr:hypothetical protein [Candidatus Aminicenantes bacterium]